MAVAVIKYNAGNVFSVLGALNRLGCDPVVTDDPGVIRRADKVVFPGVGEAASAMAYLREHGLDRLIRSLNRPVLGICIGQQLLCRHSEEGDVDCIGIFDVDVVRFRNTGTGFKVPHVGWNTLQSISPGFISPALDGAYVYYVHSYYVPVCRHTVAETDYMEPFSAALHKGNFYSTQFHPEKSGDTGSIILKGFLDL